MLNFRKLVGKRIAIASSTLEMGGAERQLLYLAQHLVENCGVGVNVIGLSRMGAAARRCDELGIPWQIVPFRWPCRKTTLARTLPQLWFKLRAARPDVIIGFGHWANVGVGLTWKMTKAKAFIWNQRDVIVDRPSCRIESMALANATRVVSNSKDGISSLARLFDLSKHPVDVIPNGVALGHLAKNSGELRRRLDISEDAVVGCMVANLRFPKDHETLFRAWKVLVNARDATEPRAILLLAGAAHQADDEHRLRKLAADLGITDTIRFLGYVRDVPALLACCDFGVFSSRSESCPNGVLECMAAGLPVVATDIPAVRHILATPDWLAGPGDDLGLASLMSRLIVDSNLRCRVGAVNRRRVADCFAMTRMCETYTQLLAEELVSSRNHD